MAINVLFLAGSIGSGKGGHIHSLNHITSALAQEIKLSIYTIGTGHNPVLAVNDNYRGNIDATRGYFYLGRRLKEIIELEKPDIIHCFDDIVFPLVYAFRTIWRIPLVLNRCGGANQNFRRNVKAPYMIMFSKENLNWYKNNSHYKDIKLYHIPQRVEDISKKLVFHDLRPYSRIRFYRIARIGHAYEKGFWKILDFVKYYSKLFPIEMNLVGVVERKDILQRLKSYVTEHKLPVKFITDDEKTTQAVKELKNADIVIATGRGLMEACALGKPVMAFAKNANHPILIKNNNIEVFSEYNFSERTLVSSDIIAQGNKELTLCLQDTTLLQSFGESNREFFKKYFWVQNAVEKYKTVYEEVLLSPPQNLALYNILYIIRSLIRLNRYKKLK